MRLFVHECVYKLTAKSFPLAELTKDYNLCPHGQGEGIVMQNEDSDKRKQGG